MAASTDIFRSWRQPRVVMRQLLAAGPREDRALIYLMVACLILFIAQMPLAARLAQTDATIPLDARLQTNFYVFVLVLPIIAYALALALFAVLRVVTRRATAFNVRLALFWTLLALAPAHLLYGLCAGFLGQAAAGTTVVGIVLAAGFFWILTQSLREGLAHV